MSLLNKIGHAIHAGAVAVSNAFSSVFGAEQAKAFGSAALHVLQSNLGKIVMKAVEDLENVKPSQPGAVKRAQVMTNVLDEAKKQGIDASESIVGLLIELAVNAMKGHYEPAA